MKINWNSYYAKKLKSAIILFLICLTICILLIALEAYKTRPININECKKIDITVQRVDYSYWYGAGQCHIYSDGIKYVLSTSNNYSSHELYEIIKEGDELTLTYTERFWIEGKHNLVVDARDSDLIYIDSNEFISDRNNGGIVFIVLMSIVELLILSCLGYNVYSKYRDLKKNSKK